MKTSFIKMQSQHGRIKKCGLVLPFERFSFFLSRCLYFHDLDKFGENTYLFMSFTDIWAWWVGLCIAMGKVWFQIGVQLPLKVLMLVYIVGLIVLNFKNRFALSAVYSFLNANCTYLENKMELDSSFGFRWVPIAPTLEKKLGATFCLRILYWCQLHLP